jgi:photosystem II stability/assembly factor-like uncharacterized protein
MRTQLVIIPLLVWLITIGATPTVTHAQSSAEWQTLPYQKQITEACFDAQRQYVLWQQDGNAYDIRTNTPLTTNSISADFTVTSVMCAPSGWVYYATTNITVLMGSRVGNVLPIQYYRTRLGESLQPMRYFPTSIDYFDPFQLYNVTIEPATTRNTLVIQQSNDAGAHWQTTSHTFATQVYDYYIPNTTSNEIYVLTRGSHRVGKSATLIDNLQLWHSTDAGAHWNSPKNIALGLSCTTIDATTQSDSSSPRCAGLDITFHRLPTPYTAKGTLAFHFNYVYNPYAHSSASKYTFISYDAGKTWSHQSTNSPYTEQSPLGSQIIYTPTHAIIPANGNNTIGLITAQWATDGQRWQEISDPVVGCSYSWRTNMGNITVLTQSPNIQFCATFNAIYQSSDGGLHWQALATAPENQQIDSRIVAVSHANPALVLLATKAGALRYHAIDIHSAAIQPVTSTAPLAIPYVSATRHTIDPRFKTYWDAHGGLAQFGYPKTEPFYAVADDEQILLVQYFERNRFEWHPDQRGTPYQVQLGLIGNYFGAKAQLLQPGPFARQNGDTEPGQIYFAETGHTLRNAFKQHWQTTGGLAQYGYPISEEFYEVSPDDDQTYVVQYFERARFEWHPDNIGTPYEVLLGLLGNQLLSEKGWE